ncbi:MAG: hypothetical protein KKF46_03560 [Nanoarchaeota archaeon]|nr:hypothetical protein [Nanoarchaeota archaeon]MBU1321412.1 hypothetical protein [Nanoarchaeota archaeon]MBU1597891.1 hypothetical protein [Nanoarchaeota archaeon]MBU2442272.1 hypothetical protein [Nanoarchaeota archaeon]
MVVADSFVINAYGAIVSWMHVLIIFLIIYKVITLFSGAGSLFGKRGGKDRTKEPWRDPDGSTTKEPKKSPKEIKEEEKRKRWEEGIENPAFLRVWVRGDHDRSLRGAEVTVYCKVNKKDTKIHLITNKDGIAPATGAVPEEHGGFLTVTSGLPIRVEAVYWIPWNEWYKSEKRSKLTAGITKKRRFKDTANFTLKKGQEYTHAFEFKIGSEYDRNFQPVILEADYESEPGRIKTKGRLDSMTGPP